jgi:hypothetical protein
MGTRDVTAIEKFQVIILEATCRKMKGFQVISPGQLQLQIV